MLSRLPMPISVSLVWAALLSLLCVSNSQAEPLISNALLVLHGDPSGQMRPPPSILGPAFSFFLDGSDAEIRMLVLDVLIALCATSTDILQRVADLPGCVELLTKIAVSVDLASSGGPTRADGYFKAGQLLASMFAQPDLYRRFMAVRTELLLAACR